MTEKREGKDLEIFPVDISFSWESPTGPLSPSFMKEAASSKLWQTKMWIARDIFPEFALFAVYNVRTSCLQRNNDKWKS